MVGTPLYLTIAFFITIVMKKLIRHLPQYKKKHIIVSTIQQINNMRYVNKYIELLYIIHEEDHQSINMIKCELMKLTNGIKYLEDYDLYKNLPYNIKQKLNKQ